MNRVSMDSEKFFGYEYKELAVDNERTSVYLDGYQHLGWIIDKREQDNGNKIILLKRDQKIVNKMELTRLQHHFETCMNEIAALEISKTSNATMCALIIGIFGMVFSVGAIYAAIHTPPMILLCVVLSIPGFFGWLLPYFVYRKMVSLRTEVVAKLIDRKYDEIHEILEKAKGLLN